MIYQPNLKRSQRKSTSRKERGQSLVELSISGMMLLFILLGVVDVGRIYFVYIALTDSAAEAALYLSIFPDCLDSTDCADPNNAEYRAEHAASGYFNWDVDGGTTRITITRPYIGLGSSLDVEIEHDVTLLTPLLPPIMGGETFTVTAKASQIIMSD